MKEKQPLTVNQLGASKLLGVSPTHIINLEADGVIQRLSWSKGARYSVQELFKLAETDFSSAVLEELEELRRVVKKLEKEKEKLENQLNKNQAVIEDLYYSNIYSNEE